MVACWGVMATVLMACTSMKENGHQSDYKLKAEELLEGELTYTFNEDSSLVLCQHINIAEQLPNPRSVHFAVLSMDSLQVLYQSKMSNATVKWFDEDELLITRHKNYPQGEHHESYVFNIINRSKKIYTKPYPSQRE